MDTRKTLRYPLELAATLSIAGSQMSCHIRDLSLGGAFVRGPGMPIGTKVILRFGRPRMSEIEAPCTVRWHNNEGSGLQFDGLRAVDTYMLARFIRTASRASAEIPTDAVLVNS